MEACESFQQQALDVRQPDDNFDPSVEPQDGEEYLMKVIYERKNCPAVVVKPIKSFKIHTMNLPESSISNDISDISPVSLRPSIEWKNAQIEDFTCLREKVTRLRLTLHENGYTDDKKLPLITNESEPWEEFCRHNEPLLSTILRINQRALERLLEFQCEWLKEDGEIDGEPMSLLDNCWLGKWIYSTLVCLKTPLEADCYGTIRDIGKTCIALRNQLKDDDQTEAAPYNLFLIIIGKYFDQLDLMEFI